MASQVKGSLSREIFDDEIFNSTDVCAEKPELEKSDLAACGNADNTPPSPSQAADTLIIERKIKPKKKKCQREPKQIIQHENEKSILQEAEKQLQLPNIQKEKSIEKTEINADEIAEAIDKAFQKVEKEESSTERSSSKRKFFNIFFAKILQISAQFTIPIITSTKHFKSSPTLSSPKSSSPSDSWIVVDQQEPASEVPSSPSEYDEVLNSCYDEI